MPLSHATEQLLAQVISSLPLIRAQMQARCDLVLTDAPRLFPDSPHPAEALAGLALQLGDWETAHTISQDLASREGSYWHAIIHRMEPDASNANYWFRRVGPHPIFPLIHSRAAAILDADRIPAFRLTASWEPDRFVRWIGEALKSGSPQNVAALQTIQGAEIKALFEYCCGPLIA